MKLKEFRKKMGVSQREVSESLNIPQTTLFSYENNVSDPSIATLIKLADYFHVTVDELIGRPTNLINKMLLSDRERSIIEKVLSLNPKLQELTEFYIDTLMNSI